jgi:hypothetical protein
MKYWPYTFRSFIEISFSMYPVTNILGKARYGPFLEMLGLGAIVRTCITGPFKGQPFSSFILGLCKQLSLVPIINATLTKETLEVLGSTKDYLVPCCAPINSSFPEEIKSLPNFYTGKILSPKNKTEMDGFFMPDDAFSPAMKLMLCRDVAANVSEENLGKLDDDTAKTRKGFFEDISTVEQSFNEAEEFSNVSEIKRADLSAAASIATRKGLAITIEMKNDVISMNRKTLLECCQKALSFRKAYINSPKISKHVHLIFVAKACSWQLKEWNDPPSSAKQSRSLPQKGKGKKGRSTTSISNCLTANNTITEPSSDSKSLESLVAGIADLTLGPSPSNEEESEVKILEDYRKCRVIVASYDKESAQVNLTEGIRTLKRLDNVDGDFITDIIVIPIESIFQHLLI